MAEIRTLAVNGQLGYGFSAEAFEIGLAKNPDFLGCDAGSSDIGPYYLGQGIPHTDRVAVKRDLEISLLGARRLKVPLIIASAGSAGARPHVNELLNILKDITQEHSLCYRLAVIWADIDKEQVRTALRAGKVKSLSNVPPLTEEDLNATCRIVAQMGVTPIIKALEMGAEVIIAGRACDTAIFAAMPIMKGFNPGIAFHAAKIVECGAYCAVPGGAGDCMFATLRDDHFLLEPLNPARRCTPLSTAAHTMYEQPDPFIFYEPDGVTDLSEAKFEAVNERVVKVSGSLFHPAKAPYRLKLEGAAQVGFRTITIGGVRDPIMLKHLPECEQYVKDGVTSNLKGKINPKDYDIKLRVYGRDAVMAHLEPTPICDHEVGVILEVLGRTQEIANSVCALARALFLHATFPGRKTTAGNVAFPYSPHDIPLGPAYKWSVYHTMEVDDLLQPFPIDITEVR